jgi:hypothetical protein
MKYRKYSTGSLTGTAWMVLLDLRDPGNHLRPYASIVVATGMVTQTAGRFRMYRIIVRRQNGYLI